jgi:hypothetical protein
MSLELTLEIAGMINNPDLLNFANWDIQTFTENFNGGFASNIFNQSQDLIAQASGAFRQDVVGDMAKGWNNFIRSGQWASLLIGLVIGYMFRVFTSSG